MPDVHYHMIMKMTEYHNCTIFNKKISTKNTCNCLILSSSTPVRTLRTMITMRIMAMKEPKMIPMTRDMVLDIPRWSLRGFWAGALVTLKKSKLLSDCGTISFYSLLSLSDLYI